MREDVNRALLGVVVVLVVVNGLSMAGVMEMSSLISELFSLLLLQEPSVSLFKFIDSVGSLVFSASICNHTHSLDFLHIFV